MTRHAATRDMVRLAASGALLALMMAPAMAADRALIDFIGYSEDGRYFAFEEFGIQDGSGFPFSNVYVVDLPADSWVTGSPFRVRLDSEEADLEDARDDAFTQAEPTLDQFGIGEPADILYLFGDGVPDDLGQEAVFGRPRHGLDEVRELRTLTIDEHEAQPAIDCALVENKVFGFSLSLDAAEIYKDPAKLPESRGCARGYNIYAILRPAEWTQAEGGLLAVIATYPLGFEGNDRRFLVVPLGN